jgi:hypothetical protein
MKSIVMFLDSVDYRGSRNLLVVGSGDAGCVTGGGLLARREPNCDNAGLGYDIV